MGRYISIHRRPAGATRGGSSCGGVVRDRGVRAGPVPARIARKSARAGRIGIVLPVAGVLL